MRIARVLDFYLGGIAISPERTGAAVFHIHNDDEVVHSVKPPFNPGAGRRRDGHRHRARIASTSAATACSGSGKPAVLQLHHIGNPSADASEISSYRVAGTAFRVEVSLA